MQYTNMVLFNSVYIPIHLKKLENLRILSLGNFIVDFSCPSWPCEIMKVLGANCFKISEIDPELALS